MISVANGSIFNFAPITQDGQVHGAVDNVQDSTISKESTNSSASSSETLDVVNNRKERVHSMVGLSNDMIDFYFEPKYALKQKGTSRVRETLKRYFFRIEAKLTDFSEKCLDEQDPSENDKNRALEITKYDIYEADTAIKQIFDQYRNYIQVFIMPKCGNQDRMTRLKDKLNLHEAVMRYHFCTKVSIIDALSMSHTL